MRIRLLTAVLPLIAWGCRGTTPPDVSPGVSLSLAEFRARTIEDVRYDLTLRIPAERDNPITGVQRIRFRLSSTRQPLVIDFVDAGKRVRSVLVEGDTVPFDTPNDHVILPPRVLRRGENVVDLHFTAGDESLNRNPDYLYTLFVPDRARFALPLFDQPSLKARFTLALEVPPGWEAVANGPVRARDSAPGGASVVRFSETKPIPTYLFSFAAGRFKVDSAERAGRMMHMYHRETDTLKVRRNRDAIFDLHAHALAWLETYTGIPYPFDKFGFVLIPAFQYGGMEHPGAILYRASGLMLDESATQNQLLGRASVIAHETAHMWFGDLVTMRWFDDVWTKEVFANFMAAKIVNPSFPEINHELRFLLAHYPAAYEIDRTEGANPIRQPLDNLREAGTLYGAIIYQKAPIVMRLLERLVGDTAFRDGLREYLQRFSFGNATWPDLVDILDRRTDADLRAWSRVWIEEAGRPRIEARLVSGPDGEVQAVHIAQSDPADKGRLWTEPLDVVLAYADSNRMAQVVLRDSAATLPVPPGRGKPRYVLLNSAGLAYGELVPDTATLAFLLDSLPTIPSDLLRGAAWVTLWDAMLAGRVAPARMIDLALHALELERSELNTQRLLTDLGTAYWRFTPPDRRQALAPRIETALWNGIERSPSRSLKTAYFRAWRSTALTPGALARLERIWRNTERVRDVPLAEPDYMTIAQGLAVRGVRNGDEILAEQLKRIQNPDRKAEFAFVMPALASDTTRRDAFFESLRIPANREHEPWVTEGLGYLNHPLRAPRAERYIQPGLELLEEIQRTGDIFFPLGWLNATLDGHQSQAAAAIVRQFLDRTSANYPPRLRAKILQAADPLFRSADITGRP